MRFLADMGMAMDVIAGLRAAGHDAVHLRDLGLQRLADERIIALAVEEKRIILTHDLDFGRLLALGGAAEPSLVTFRLTDMTPHSVLQRLLPLSGSLRAELERGCAVTVTDGANRYRRLPMRDPIGSTPDE